MPVIVAAGIAAVDPSGLVFQQAPNGSCPVTLLINPRRSEVLASLRNAAAYVREYRDDPAWLGGQVEFIFAGHGRENGHLELAEDSLSAAEIVEQFAASSRSAAVKRLRLAVVLDSCFSGRTLA
jgi:hypothetical protein